MAPATVNSPGWGRLHPLRPLRPLHPACTRSVSVLRPGPWPPLCFFVFVFSPPPSALEASGRPLNERSVTLRPVRGRCAGDAAAVVAVAVVVVVVKKKRKKKKAWMGKEVVSSSTPSST